jgi:acyl-CoA thioester hydrolase
VKPPFVYTMRVRFRDTDLQGHVYLGSARFEEDVYIETRISKVGSSSVTSTFVIRNSEQERLANASVTSACIDPKTRHKVGVPDRFREAVAAFEEGRGDG